MEGLSKALETFEAALRCFDGFYALPVDFGRAVTEAEAEETLKAWLDEYEDYDEHAERVSGMLRTEALDESLDEYYTGVVRSAAKGFKTNPDAAASRWIIFACMDCDDNYSGLEEEGAAWALIDLYPNTKPAEHMADLLGDGVKWQLLPVFEEDGEPVPDGFFSTLDGEPEQDAAEEAETAGEDAEGDAEKRLRFAEALFDIAWEASFQFQKRCEKSYPSNSWDSRDLFAHAFDWAGRFEKEAETLDEGLFDYGTEIAEFAKKHLDEYFSLFGIFPNEEGGDAA